MPDSGDVRSTGALETWLRTEDKALAKGQKPLTPGIGEADVGRVLDALAEELCFDEETLKDCWDDLKNRVPGAARRKIQDAVDRSEEDKFWKELRTDGFVSGSNWAIAAVITLLTMVLPATIGALFNRDNPEGDEEMEAEKWYEVWGPLLLLFAIEVGVCSTLGPKIGWDMIEQRSVDSSMKEAMRSNMTNQSVIGTLLLTVVWAMAQGEYANLGGSNPRMEDDLANLLLTPSVLCIGTARQLRTVSIRKRDGSCRNGTRASSSCPSGCYSFPS